MMTLTTMTPGKAQGLEEGDHFITVDDVRLYYRVGGNGPFLLLLHGFTLSSEQWDEHFEAFARDFKVIALDFPGHGRSAMLGKPFRFELWAGLAIQLIKKLNIPKVKAVGHSAGAITLMHMAMHDPKLIESMVIISGAHRYSEASLKMLANDAFGHAGEKWQAYYRKIHFNDMIKIHSQYVDIRHMVRNASGELTGETLGVEAMNAIPVPILLVFGDNDVYFPPEIVLELYSALPNARLWMIPGGGHTPVWYEMSGDTIAPAIFRQVSIDFLKKN